jgi:hypothetical protein
MKGRKPVRPLVLAIPRGGVITGAVLARELGAELDVVWRANCARQTSRSWLWEQSARKDASQPLRPVPASSTLGIEPHVGS